MHGSSLQGDVEWYRQKAVDAGGPVLELGTALYPRPSTIDRSDVMRRLRYSVAATLDGFIADPNGGYDWIIMDEAIDFAAIFDEFETFVMGRKTWDVSATADPGSMGDMFAGKEVIVFSRTLKSARPGVTIINTDPAETVRALKQRPGKDIWLYGGGSMFRTLVDADLSTPSKSRSCRSFCRKACRCWHRASASPA